MQTFFVYTFDPSFWRLKGYYFFRGWDCRCNDVSAQIQVCIAESARNLNWRCNAERYAENADICWKCRDLNWNRHWTAEIRLSGAIKFYWVLITILLKSGITRRKYMAIIKWIQISAAVLFWSWSMVALYKMVMCIGKVEGTGCIMSEYDPNQLSALWWIYRQPRD